MLSILIPVYNRNIAPLINDLSYQLENATIDYEILICDDKSFPKYIKQNGSLADNKHIFFYLNQENAGRSKTRNFLAFKARFPYLLFIDCDANIIDKQFINKYLQEIDKHKDNGSFVINGGTSYRNTPPNQIHFLRWQYGKIREEIPAQKRNLNPYRSFTPFNIICSSSIFKIIQFDESLKNYGNEDTLFGIALKNANIPIFHVDNQLYHDGIDTNTIFLKKIESAINNLIYLYRNKMIDEGFIKENKLLRCYFTCKKLHILFFIKLIYRSFNKFIIRKINSDISLFWLDFYKLGYLTEILTNHEIAN